MQHLRRSIFRPTIVTRATAYDEQPPEGDDALVIPEDLTTLSADDLRDLETRAVEAFDAIFQSGQVELTDEDMDNLRTLRTGIDAVRAQLAALDEVVAERADEAATLAAAIHPVEDTEETPEETPDEGDEDGDGDSEETPVEEPEAIAASGAQRRELRVNLSGLRSRQSRPATPPEPETDGMRSIVFAAPNLSGFREGQGMDWADMGRAIDRQLQSYPHRQYQSAAAAGRAMKQQFGLVTIQKPFAEDMIIRSDDAVHVEEVLTRAADETLLPGGSLVASGWCAPSETIYDLCEMESRDGLYSLPEVNAPRGGLRSSLGPSFSTLFNDIGFSYTEAEAIAGDWDGEGGGAKPCFTVECPDFTDTRLRLDGLCIQAGLLQRRGFPELIGRVTRGALVAHDHRVASGKISAVAAASTAVTMPGSQVGTLAPILQAIELQTEHYRESRRLSRNATIEAVFPFWVRGAIRADLSRRTGVDLISVPDSRIAAWFMERQIAPQFVYNWQGLAASTPASGLTAFPETIDFLLYAAGTWVALGSDVITLDTVYDSTLLGTNDYTALFSEEGWEVVQRCEDSRKVTVPICADGATSIAVAVDCDGTAGA